MNVNRISFRLMLFGFIVCILANPAIVQAGKSERVILGECSVVSVWSEKAEMYTIRTYYDDVGQYRPYCDSYVALYDNNGKEVSKIHLARISRMYYLYAPAPNWDYKYNMVVVKYDIDSYAVFRVGVEYSLEKLIDISLNGTDIPGFYDINDNGYIEMLCNVEDVDKYNSYIRDVPLRDCISFETFNGGFIGINPLAERDIAITYYGIEVQNTTK